MPSSTLSLSLELPDFPGCEMYQHVSKQYFEIVSLILLWEMIHMVSVTDTEWGFFGRSKPGEDGQWHEPLSSLVSVLWTGGRGDNRLFVISSCQFESHQDPYQQILFSDNTQHITLNGISFSKQHSVLWSTWRTDESWVQSDLIYQPGIWEKRRHLHNTSLWLHELGAGVVYKHSRYRSGNVYGGNLGTRLETHNPRRFHILKSPNLNWKKDSVALHSV